MIPKKLSNNKMLSQEQIQRFIQDGVIVIPSILTSSEVEEARKGFHESLKSYGCNVDQLEDTADALKKLSSTNGAGGILDLFYADWKLKLNEHPQVLSVIQQLWEATYNHQQGQSSELDRVYSHPFGEFDTKKGYMYIDRVCYRLPDRIAQKSKSKKEHLQRSLTPHLDCCPQNRFGGNKWRPVQCFIALTDTLEPNEGGFEACKGLHSEFDTWAANRQPSPDGKVPCVGQFTPIRPKEDRDILDRMEHIPCRAGDLVCWDYRIAHANAYRNNSSNGREVVYIGLLPCIPLNQQYAQDQLVKYRQGILPSDQWHESALTQACDYDFSSLGKKLMTMDPW